MKGGGGRIKRYESGSFVVVAVIVTVLFGWLIGTYFGAILWGLVAAILFEPATRRLADRFNGRKNLAAALVLLLILALIVLPAFVLGASLIQEAASLYERIRTGQVDIPGTLNQIRDALPDTVRRFIEREGPADFEEVRRTFGSGVAAGLQNVASGALVIGQSALSFLAALGVMLYLTFFLLRDGRHYGELIRAAMPLRPDVRDRLIDNFVMVVRATMKGTVVVALVQGTLGGIIFWSLGIEGALLWGTLMGFFSLLPAVGTGIIWVPVAAYLLASGSWMAGAIMIFCGIFVIGLVDNLLRPILVGRDTRMPDFVVLIATLSGLEVAGLSGFIIGPVIAALFIAAWSMVIEQRVQYIAPVPPASDDPVAPEDRQNPV